MFEKKYSPVVLSKGSMFAFHLAERAIRYILQDEMLRFLHMTIDDTKWQKPSSYGSDILMHKSEITISALCRNGKMVEIEAEIILMKRLDGDWIISSGIDCDRVRFPSCKTLKGFYVYFGAGANDETGEINYGTVWEVNVASQTFRSPLDKAISDVREKLIAG